MAQASLLACEGLAGVSLVPTAASKKMMLSQIASKQAENGERAGSPDVLRCSSQGHRKDSDKSRSRKDDDSLSEASHSKKTVKKVVVVEQNGSFQVKIPKNFVCEHCFGAFRSSYHLKRHILIHTGVYTLLRVKVSEKTGMKSLPYIPPHIHFSVHLGQVRSHLSVIYVICVSSRSTTWNATSVCTVVKSLTSVNGVISVFLGQIDYSDTNGCAKGASPRLPTGSFLYRRKGPGWWE
ncbi:zinc finger protein 740 isoform X1 [Nomascus leucogenys]|uniref:zinc finger protein 740 isoform X1 n=2 Tax=Nomascus leucogenys TaxID=61853 RepID=UPI00122D6AE5|nr:zinc finger protein 740 isoform X1 [Nomascus leucogenys]XP_032029522.1 zinc finger protein 740 isoform X1 [Hylobates moloch]